MRVDIIATGTGSERSKGSEVWLLGAIDNHRRRYSLSFDKEDWDLIQRVKLPFGLSGGPFHKTMKGKLTTYGSAVSGLYFLSHPWSGSVDIGSNEHVHRIDLYSEETQLLHVDPSNGVARPVTELEMKEVFEFEIGTKEPAAPSPIDKLMPVQIRAGSKGVRIIYTGRARSSGTKQQIEEIATRRKGWQTYDIGASDHDDAPAVRYGLKGEANATLMLSLEADDHLIFQKTQGGSNVTITVNGRTQSLSLDGIPGPVPVHIAAFSRLSSHNAISAIPPEVPLYHGVHIDPAKPLALYLPRWKGVAMSTRMLFEQSVAITAPEVHPNDIQDKDVSRITAGLLETGCRHFVISGGDLFWLNIIHKFRSLDLDVRFDLLWHSNYAQLGEPHDWHLWSHWLAAHKDGLITRIGVVKEGYDEFLQGLGIDAVFIPNIVKTDIDKIHPNDHNDSIGVWLSGSSNYRKPVLPSLIALALLGKFTLKGSGLGDSGIVAADQLGLRLDGVHAAPISVAKLHQEMSSTAATLYVTLSECSPMLPLESLALGVPCLVGPSSHLFRHDDKLRDWLVVEHPTDARMIAKKLDRAVEDRSEIVEAYREYARMEVKEAEAGVARLLT